MPEPSQAFTINPAPGRTVGGAILRPHRLEILCRGKVAAIATLSDEQAREWSLRAVDRFDVTVEVDKPFTADGARLIVDDHAEHVGLFAREFSLFTNDTLTVHIQRSLGN